jgi:hypothetical protein
MSDARTVLLVDPKQAHRALMALWEFLKPLLAEGRRYVLELREETRTLAQNRRQWAILTDLSEQVTFFGQKYCQDDWKDIITASLAGELRMAPTLDGKRMVILGLRTSKFSKKKHSEFTALAMAFGDESGVQWSPTSLGREFASHMEPA